MIVIGEVKSIFIIGNFNIIEAMYPSLNDGARMCNFNIAIIYFIQRPGLNK